FLKRKRVNLIVTDFQMPVFDGLQLTAAVRSIDSTVPVVIVSGKEIRDDVTKSGANAFLWKAALLTELGPTLERVGVHTTRSGLGWMSTAFQTPALSKPVHVSQSNRA
ncbi:MAG TPA: response regulator, partial [Opitutaceae bacterium]|nr:response regulator [Opitutaceae bacterium]